MPQQQQEDYDDTNLVSREEGMTFLSAANLIMPSIPLERQQPES